jgi:hypothetical protein
MTTHQNLNSLWEISQTIENGIVDKKWFPQWINNEPMQHNLWMSNMIWKCQSPSKSENFVYFLAKYEIWISKNNISSPKFQQSQTYWFHPHNVNVSYIGVRKCWMTISCNINKYQKNINEPFSNIHLRFHKTTKTPTHIYIIMLTITRFI